MKRKIVLGILLAACAVGLAVNVSVVVTREAALARDSVWRFRIGGFDPLDPFRGRYIRFRVPGLLTVRGSSAIGVLENAEKERPDPFEGIEKGSAFFALLERVDGGYGRIASVSPFKPESEGDWLRMRYLGDGVIESLFDRYYVNEAKADALDKEFRQKSGKAYITVRISSGIGVVTGLGFEE